MAFGVQSLIGSFGARLGLDTSDYARGIINAQGLNAVFGQSFATFISNPLLGSIQLFQQAGRAALGWASDALNSAQQVSVLSRQLNASTDLIQALRAQYDGLGQSFETAIPSLVKLVQAIDQAKRGTGPAAEELQRLGISLAGVTSLDQALERLIDGLSRIQDPTDRLAASQRILGEQGAKVIAVLGDQEGSLARVIEYYRQLGLVVDSDTIRSTNALKDQLGEIEQAIQGVQRSATSAFLKGFAQEFLDGANNVEGFAQAINLRVVPAAETLGRQTGELVGNLDTIIRRLEEITRFVDGIGDSWLGQGLGYIGSAFTGELFDRDLWRGIAYEANREWFGQAYADRSDNTFYAQQEMARWRGRAARR